jgi:hypothetical protein
MSQLEPLTPPTTASTEQIQIPPAVAEALEHTHAQVVDRLDEFAAK